MIKKYHRMDRLKGRTDDMLIIRGVNVFPSQIESVLLTHREVAPVYLLLVDRGKNLDQIEVQAENSMPPVRKKWTFLLRTCKKT